MKLPVRTPDIHSGLTFLVTRVWICFIIQDDRIGRSAEWNRKGWRTQAAQQEHLKNIDENLSSETKRKFTKYRKAFMERYSPAVDPCFEFRQVPCTQRDWSSFRWNNGYYTKITSFRWLPVKQAGPKKSWTNSVDSWLGQSGRANLISATVLPWPWL